jgi:hypothetical protein
MSYRGRPSNLSRARRRNETGPQLNTALYQSIMTQIEVMNPGEHIVISPDKAQQIRLNTIRVRLYGYNERYSTNFVVHKHTDGSVYIWYNPCATNTKRETTQHSTQNRTNTRKHSRAIVRHIETPKHDTGAFEALPWDRQMTLRINAGIAIRNERKNTRSLATYSNHHHLIPATHN